LQRVTRGGVQKLWAGRVSKITMNKRIIELVRSGKEILRKEGSLSFLKHVLLFFACLMNRALGKIIIKILFAPVVRRRIEKTVQFYETVRLEKELDMLNRKQEVRMMNFRHYLPTTEERIERLRRVINKRPVAIILHGPSLTELEERITELEDCDICYATVNVFRPIEKHILQKINRNISLFMCSNAPSLYQEMNNHNLIDFLERQEDNFFISGRKSFQTQKMPEGFHLDKFDKKLLFFTPTAITSITMRMGRGLYLEVPSIEYPLHFPGQSSFSILLSLAVIGGASKVVIFGGDGGRISGRELHYRESGLHIPESVLEQNLRRVA